VTHKREKTTKEILDYFSLLAEKRNNKIIEIDVQNIKQTKSKIFYKKCNSVFDTIGHNDSRAGSEKLKNQGQEQLIPYGCAKCKSNLLKYHVKRPKRETHHAWKGEYYKLRHEARRLL
jgi:hypothetical protein